MVEDNVEEVAHALEDCTEDIATVTSDDIADVASTLEHIVAVEIPSKEVYLFATLYLFVTLGVFEVVLYPNQSPLSNLCSAKPH